jgi:hypothetical protein
VVPIKEGMRKETHLNLNPRGTYLVFIILFYDKMFQKKHSGMGA